MLAAATAALAGLTWLDIHRNRDLLKEAQRQAVAMEDSVTAQREQADTVKRQTDLLWAAAVPTIQPEDVRDVRGERLSLQGQLIVSYASGTIPAREVRAWVGVDAGVLTGGIDLLTGTDMRPLNVVPLVQSRAGSEPPAAWSDWIGASVPNVDARVVMSWRGPAGHVTEHAWERQFSLWRTVEARAEAR
jgi:hypothetical protein